MNPLYNSLKRDFNIVPAEFAPVVGLARKLLRERCAGTQGGGAPVDAFADEASIWRHAVATVRENRP